MAAAARRSPPHRGRRRKSLGERDDRAARPRHHPYRDQYPLSRLTGAIHVYGGDFFAVARSGMGSGDAHRAEYDVEKNMRLFEAANRR